jgi:hypothetical protein
MTTWNKQLSPEELSEMQNHGISNYYISPEDRDMIERIIGTESYPDPQQCAEPGCITLLNYKNIERGYTECDTHRKPNFLWVDQALSDATVEKMKETAIRQAKRYDRECGWCGKKFKTIDHRRKFCGGSCAAKNRWSKRRCR